MPTPTTPLENLEQEAHDENLIQFHRNFSDYGHLIVSRLRYDKTREIIGHVYTEIAGDEFQYISTDRDGRELFPQSSDFSNVSREFEHLAHLIAVQERSKENDKSFINNNYSPLKTQTIMKNSTKNLNQSKTKINQLIFVEYEKPTKDGHFITVGDSYKNTIGKIYKVYNEETKKFEYTALDHAGNFLSKNEKLWELKNEYINNREQLLEQAHQRRIESKAQAKQTVEQSQTVKGEKQPEAKPQEKESSSPKEIPPSRQEEREQELEDLRGNWEDEERGEIHLER